MNGRSLMLVGAVLALVVATTGCGSKKKSSTPPAQTTTQAAATTTTTEQMTTGTSTSSSGIASVATAGNCKQLSDLSAAFTKALSGTGASDFEKRAQVLKEFADKTPSDIRPDFQVLADAFAKYASAFKDVHFTPGQVPNAATLAKLQNLVAQIDQTAVTRASTHISAWAQKNCTHA